MKKDRTSKFNEMTRVQIPALVHLTRLGYEYFGKINEEMAGNVYDPDTNILKNVFITQFLNLNPHCTREDAIQTLINIRNELNNDDLGKTFYKRLNSTSPTQLIDYNNPNNNLFHVTGEFTCKNGQEEFRPDITLFINGLPLVFIEVKKPNNADGILAESKRMTESRFPNRHFRRFINITQLMIFSNNMEYNAQGGVIPIEGVFYCTGARTSSPFNCFREQNKQNKEIAPFIRDFTYRIKDKNVEQQIVKDFNCENILGTNEYKTNSDINTPTNRTLTSMCSKERLLFILKYGIAYVNIRKEIDGKLYEIEEKHIMRYQQMFAAFAILNRLEEGEKATTTLTNINTGKFVDDTKSGLIWHTQGSGKTALSFYLTYILTDYFSKKGIVPRYYFIVDRLDLLEQATQEFEARGLTVVTANSRAELMAQFAQNQSLESSLGKPEITVVNIQRFAADTEKVSIPQYATNLQRIFIIDEAHRGYKPLGCFLANLFDADKNSIKIALTGTPLLKNEVESCKVFGPYIDTYYYDQSIADGYTLKIMREDIETSCREKLDKIYDDLSEKLNRSVTKKELPKSEIVTHDNYVQELTRYIISDLISFRKYRADNTLGGMIICENSTQARKIFDCFNKMQDEVNTEGPRLRAELILHDVYDKEKRKKIVNDFKNNLTIDILIVFNMLLTGFDAPRLKRLYFGRKLKDHTLLQALTRVNRPYKNNLYGYIVDFADIKQNFDDTNKEYLEELNKFTEDKIIETILINREEIMKQVKDAGQTLFLYETNDLEKFSQQVSNIEENEELYKLRSALETARDCANLVRTWGDDKLKEDFKEVQILRVAEMLSEVNRRIELNNQINRIVRNPELVTSINEIMAEIEFKFEFKGSEILEIASGAEELKNKWKEIIYNFSKNEDQDDEDFITLRKAFIARFSERGFNIKDLKQFNETKKEMEGYTKKLQTLNQKNESLKSKYNGDIKFARIHKRIREENKVRSKTKQEPIISTYDNDITKTLLPIKIQLDKKISAQEHIIEKDGFFDAEVRRQVIYGLDTLGKEPRKEDIIFIQQRVSNEYLMQYRSTYI